MIKNIVDNTIKNLPKKERTHYNIINKEKRYAMNDNMYEYKRQLFFSLNPPERLLMM